MTELATIGHNRGPFETTSQHIADLHDELKNWLDGEELTTKKQHDTLIGLIGDMRKALKACDDIRKDEVKFWNDGKKEVQDRYNPFLKMARTAIDMGVKFLEPYLAEQTRIKRQRDDGLAAAAAIAMDEASTLMKASSGHLAAREEAEHRYDDALEMGKIAKKSREQNVAHGARKRWDVVLVDRASAAQGLWENHAEEFDELLVGLAKGLVAAGKRELPGFTITKRIVVRKDTTWT